MQDFTLIALGQALELAIASERQLLAALPEMPGGALDGKVVDLVVGPASGLCDLIAAIEAHTPEGRAVRARAARFLQGDEQAAA